MLQDHKSMAYRRVASQSGSTLWEASQLILAQLTLLLLPRGVSGIWF
jgi:hypothetical protein